MIKRLAKAIWQTCTVFLLTIFSISIVALFIYGFLVAACNACNYPKTSATLFIVFLFTGVTAHFYNEDSK